MYYLILILLVCSSGELFASDTGATDIPQLEKKGSAAPLLEPAGMVALPKELIDSITNNSLSLAQVSAYLDTETNVENMISIYVMHRKTVYDNALSLSTKLNHFGKADANDSQIPTLEEIEHAVAGLTLVLEAAKKARQERLQEEITRARIISWLIPSQYNGPPSVRGKYKSHSNLSGELRALEDLLKFKRESQANAEAIDRWLALKKEPSIRRRLEKRIKNNDFVDSELSKILHDTSHPHRELLCTVVRGKQESLFMFVRGIIKDYKSHELKKAFQALQLVELSSQDLGYRKDCDEPRKLLTAKYYRTMLDEAYSIASCSDVITFDDITIGNAREWWELIKRYEFEGKEAEVKDDHWKKMKKFFDQDSKGEASSDSLNKDDSETSILSTLFSAEGFIVGTVLAVAAYFGWRYSQSEKSVVVAEKVSAPAKK